jgi:hypothetical protein
MEVHRQSMSQELTPTGGRSSGEEVKISSISTTRRLLMFTKTRILKDKRLLYGRDTTAGTKDGEFFILTKQHRKEQVDSIRNMDCTSTDHSTSDPDFQCRELLNLSHGMLESEDTMPEEEINRLGDSTENPTLLQIKTGRTTHLISPVTERVPT